MTKVVEIVKKDKIRKMIIEKIIPAICGKISKVLKIKPYLQTTG